MSSFGNSNVVKKIGAYFAPFAMGLIFGAVSLFICTRWAAQWLPEVARSKKFDAPERNVPRMPRLRDELLLRFNAYVAGRSRRHRIKLEEVVSVYLRVDSQECVALLHSLNAGCLVDSPHSSLAVYLREDVNDLIGTLRAGADMDGRVADIIITEAFRAKIKSDPAKAFEYLTSLPMYLRDSLAMDLVKSWSMQDAAAATRAFGLVWKQWPNQFQEALAGLAVNDPEAAFKSVSFLEGATIQRREGFVSDLLFKLSSRNSDTAIQLLKEHPEIPAVRARPSLQAWGTKFIGADLSRVTEAVADLPSDNLRREAYSAFADSLMGRDPALAIRIGGQLPDTENSLASIRKAATKLGSTSGDPFSVLEEQTDLYQHIAIVNGVTEGLYQSKGMDGVAGAVDRGISSNDSLWFEAAGELILSAKGTGPEDKTERAWQALPSDIKRALIEYAGANWPAEKASALTQTIR